MQSTHGIGYCRVWKSVRHRRQIGISSSGEVDSRELKKASVLIWISVFFIVCQSVKLAPDFYELLYCIHTQVYLVLVYFMVSYIYIYTSMYYFVTQHCTFFFFQEKECESTTAIEFMISFGTLLTVLNSSMNFIIYMWRGKEFRQVFKKKIPVCGYFVVTRHCHQPQR